MRGIMHTVHRDLTFPRVTITMQNRFPLAPFDADFALSAERANQGLRGVEVFLRFSRNLRHRQRMIRERLEDTRGLAAISVPILRPYRNPRRLPLSCRWKHRYRMYRGLPEV